MHTTRHEKRHHFSGKTVSHTIAIVLLHNKTILSCFNLGWVVWVAVQSIPCWIWCFWIRCTQIQYNYWIPAVAITN